MADKKFTSGPWKVIFLTEHTGEECVLVIPTDVHGVHRGSGPICEVLSKKLDDADEISISNAKLIAAAPEMLEALEDAIAICEKDMQYILYNGRLRSVLHAAIAKAKGEKA